MNLCPKAVFRIILCGCVLAVLPALTGISTARAEEDYIYSPTGCDFNITLPTEPYTTRRCNPSLPDKCDLMAGYTKVYDLSTTVNFYISCDVLEEDVFDRYGADSMKTVLIARGGRRLETSQTGYTEDEDMKAASLLGAGDAPNGDGLMIYVGQLWVGHNSIMTIEGELIGTASPEADKEFADILRSIHHKNQPLENTDAEDTDTPENTEEETGTEE